MKAQAEYVAAAPAQMLDEGHAAMETPATAPRMAHVSGASTQPGTGIRGALKRARVTLKIPLMRALSMLAVLGMDASACSIDDLPDLSPQRILLIRSDRIGDLLCSTPLIAGLHRRWPDAEMTLVGGPKNRATSALLPYLRRGPEFRRDPAAWLRLAAWLPRQRFDLAVSLRSEVLSGVFIAAASRAPVRMAVQPSPRTAPAFNVFAGGDDIHQTRRYWNAARNLGVTLPGEAPRPLIELPSNHDAIAESILQALGVSEHAIKVGVAIPSRADRRHRRRAWPYAELRDTVAGLTGRGIEVMLAPGNRAERAEAEQIAKDVPATRLLPEMSLSELASVQRRLDAWIGTSSGLLHLAVAVGTPTVSIGTAALAQSWAPLGPLHRQVCADDPAQITASRVIDALFALLGDATHRASTSAAAQSA